jgi:ubiquinone biosynthesis protein
MTEPVPPFDAITESDGPADLAIGAFTHDGPWIVEPTTMPWRFGTGGEPGVDTLRLQAGELARTLVHSHHLPSVGRLLSVAYRLGIPLVLWGAKERGTPGSRSGLSKRLRPAFEHLGPTYIKLGQIISSGEGIFPEELVTEFRLLRDRVPPEPFPIVRRTVEQDLGSCLADVFTSFDPTPIASASIAQVHAATLRTGERVVVKVQRSRVAPLVRLDIAAMAWIAPFLVGRIPVTALTNPPALVELFAETIVEELDFRLEAQNMLDIAEVFAGTDQRTVVVPRPHPELVTRRVLVMEHLHGFPWSDAEGMREAGIDTAAVLRSSLIAFLEGALLYGVFHGDLHGGNMMVQSDGTVALLDFGITARLDEGKRQAFLRLQMGASTNNVAVQVEALRDLGALPADSDIDAVIRDLNLDRPPLDPTTLTADEMMAELREVTKALLGYGARLPKELMLFVKNMLFLNGAMATMAPDVDILGEIVAIVTYFTQRHGDRIAREVGFEVTTDTIDLDGYRAAMGFTEDADAITFRDLQERRELIAKRLEAHERPKRRIPLLRAVYRMIRPATEAHSG